MINPLNENVIVQVLKNEDEGMGVLLPDTHKKEEFGMGVVLAVEKGLAVKVGDQVVFDKVLLTNVKIQGDELCFIKFSDLLGYERPDRTTKAGTSKIDRAEVREEEKLQNPEEPSAS